MFLDLPRKLSGPQSTLTPRGTELVCAVFTGPTEIFYHEEKTYSSKSTAKTQSRGKIDIVTGALAKKESAALRLLFR
jgi:hypothetical protein